VLDRRLEDERERHFLEERHPVRLFPVSLFFRISSRSRHVQKKPDPGDRPTRLIQATCSNADALLRPEDANAGYPFDGEELGDERHADAGDPLYGEVLGNERRADAGDPLYGEVLGDERRRAGAVAGSVSPAEARAATAVEARQLRGDVGRTTSKVTRSLSECLLLLQISATFSHASI
jgi:hypothetical protein